MPTKDASPSALSQAFEHRLSRALSLLGMDPEQRAIDAFADPEGALCTLKSAADSPLLFKVLPDLKAAAAPGFAPLPADPLWLKAIPGQSRVLLAPLHLEAGDTVAKASEARCKSVEIRVESRPCCDAPSCKETRAFASSWVLLESIAGTAPEGLIVAEARANTPDQAVMTLRPLSNELARLLGTKLSEEGGATETAAKPKALDERLPRDWKAFEIARYTLRAEGDRIVLRDHGSRGPKNTASRMLLISAVLFLAALALWSLFARSIQNGETGSAIALFAVSALVSLAFYAFFGVGRFASRYAAHSNPLVVLGNDRVIVAPWVSRDGAVDLRMEGRFGAAIPTGEVAGSAITKRGARHIVLLSTDHGPFDAVPCSGERVAALYKNALERTLQEIKHPRTQPSARQRARNR